MNAQENDILSKALDLFSQRRYNESKEAFQNLQQVTKDQGTKDDCQFNIACCLAASSSFEQASDIWSSVTGQQRNDLLYNKALSLYHQSEDEAALVQVNKLIENCFHLYPEFSIKGDVNLLFKEDLDDPEHSKRLHDSCLIEALNLKAAILSKKSIDEARKCFEELPIKSSEQLDCVTLHNQAIYNHESEPHSCIDKLIYLSEVAQKKDGEQALFVPEQTYFNALVLCLKACQYGVGSEFLSAHKDAISRYLDEDTIAYFETIMSEKSSDEIKYNNLDKILSRILSKKAKPELGRQSDAHLVEFCLAVVTRQAEILWDGCQYQAIERLLNRVSSVVGSSALWKKNMAHTLFMQDTRYAECALLYEGILNDGEPESLLKVDPVVIGNLCVSYVLTARTAEAEALIKDVEADQEDETSSSAIGNDKVLLTEGQLNTCNARLTHLCILNLIIGTLYCVKFNYSYGLMRVFKALEPIEQRLHPQTWFHAKRCILSLLDRHCKQMICAKDELFQQVIEMLMQCEQHGVQVRTYNSVRITNGNGTDGRDSVTYEARLLRSIALSLHHD